MGLFRKLAPAKNRKKSNLTRGYKARERGTICFYNQEKQKREEKTIYYQT